MGNQYWHSYVSVKVTVTIGAPDAVRSSPATRLSPSAAHLASCQLCTPNLPDPVLHLHLLPISPPQLDRANRAG